MGLIADFLVATELGRKISSGDFFGLGDGNGEVSWGKHIYAPVGTCKKRGDKATVAMKFRDGTLGIEKDGIVYRAVREVNAGQNVGHHVDWESHGMGERAESSYNKECDMFYPGE